MDNGQIIIRFPSKGNDKPEWVYYSFSECGAKEILNGKLLKITTQHPDYASLLWVETVKEEYLEEEGEGSE